MGNCVKRDLDVKHINMTLWQRAKAMAEVRRIGVMTTVDTRVLPAKLEQWDMVWEMMEVHLEHRDCSERVKYDIYVSAEEIFTNIASYAYETDDGMVEISCGINEKEDKEFWICFKDWGIPYNPMECPDPDFNIPFEKRKIGGLGIYMVKKFMDRVEYRNEDGCNIVTIGKRL